MAVNISVIQYGAKGNGVTDDTAAINSAITYANTHGGGIVNFPDGIYLVNINTGIVHKSNVTLKFASVNAILTAIAASTGYNHVILMAGISNASIIGGKIIGDRYIHEGGSGDEHGMGIAVHTCSNISISDIYITSCFGDGIYLGNTGVGSGTFNNGVVIENFYIEYCRRNGISLISNKNVTIRNGECRYISNTDNPGLPQCGIEFEPNDNTDWTGLNVLVENVLSHDNGHYGIWVCGYFDNPGVHDVDITVQNCDLHDNGISNWLLSDFDDSETRIVTYTPSYTPPEETTDAEDVATAKAALGPLYPIEGIDTNVNVMAEALVNAVVSGVYVYLMSSDNTQINGDTGEITYGETIGSGMLTFFITKGEAYDIASYIATVPVHDEEIIPDPDPDPDPDPENSPSDPEKLFIGDNRPTGTITITPYGESTPIIMDDITSINVGKTKGGASRATFSVLNDGAKYAPDPDGPYHHVLYPNSDVVITMGYGVNQTKVFKGLLDAPRMNALPEGAMVTVTARDYSKLLLDQTIQMMYDGRLTNKVIFQWQYIEDIVRTLGEWAGFTGYMNITNTGIQVPLIDFDQQSYADGLQTLAEMCKYEWFLDDDRILIFRPAVDPAPISNHEFTEGIDIHNLDYGISDSELYSQVVAFGTDVDGLDLYAIAPCWLEEYGIPWQKTMFINTSGTHTQSSLQDLVDREAAFISTKAREVTFLANGTPDLKIGDCITVTESTTTISEIYRVFDFSHDLYPTENEIVFETTIKCYHYAALPE